MKSLLLLLLAVPAGAQTTIDSDAWILGAVGVGTTSPGAPLEVAADDSHAAVFRVSGVDETPFLIVGQDGKVGVSTTPEAGLDVSGVGDASDIVVQLDAGDLAPETSTYQLTLGYAGGESYRHAIGSKHADSVSGNAIEFYLWTPGAGGESAIGDQRVLSLVTTSTGASVHINPVGTPEYELVVSSGQTTGGGTVSAADIVEPSSRSLKRDIRPLGPEARRRALREIEGLRHRSYRYVGSASRVRGLIYEESPASVRSGGGSLSFSERVVNAELALQALIGRLEALEKDDE